MELKWKAFNGSLEKNTVLTNWLKCSKCLKCLKCSVESMSMVHQESALFTTCGKYMHANGGEAPVCSFNYFAWSCNN